MIRKLLGTILHNESDTVRIPLYSVEGSPNVWAPCDGDRSELYDTGTPVERLHSAWGGDAWDLRTDDDAIDEAIGDDWDRCRVCGKIVPGCCGECGCDSK